MNESQEISLKNVMKNAKKHLKTHKDLIIEMDKKLHQVSKQISFSDFTTKKKS